MATEYKLSYPAAEINEKLGKIVDLDTTLTHEGEAADAKATGDALNQIKDELADITEPTANVCTSNVGRYYVADVTGEIKESSETFVGMQSYVPCEPNTSYVFSCFGSETATTSRLFVAWYTDEKTFISRVYINRAGTTFHYVFTSPENAAYMAMCVYNTSGISVNAKLQITKGSVNPTEYTKPYKIVDARELVEELESKVIEYHTDKTLSVRWGTNAEIVLLGDSIIQGVGSSDYSATGETIVTIDGIAYKRNTGIKSWAAKFKSKLESEYYGLTVVNNGLPGQGIQVITENLDSLVTTNTKYAIVCAGINNRNSGASTIQAYYENLFHALKAKNINIFALSPIDVNNAAYKSSPALINTALERACVTCDVPYYNLYGAYNAVLYANTKAEYYNDTLHPNDKGYATMYGIICQLLNF